MPGSERRRRSASSNGSPTVRSSAAARAAARTIVRERSGPTPAWCHSHDGMAAQVAALGNTRIPSGAGPGAASPSRPTSRAQERRASSPVTFCSSTAGTNDSSTRPVRGTRQPVERRHASRRSGWSGTKPARPASSAAPSRVGKVSPSQSAPGPQARIVTTEAEPASTTRCWVAGPSGVRAVRQTEPPTNRKVGSKPPRRSGPNVLRRSTGRPGSQVRVAVAVASPSSVTGAALSPAVRTSAPNGP